MLGEPVLTEREEANQARQGSKAHARYMEQYIRSVSVPKATNRACISGQRATTPISVTRARPRHERQGRRGKARTQKGKSRSGCPPTVVVSLMLSRGTKGEGTSRSTSAYHPGLLSTQDPGVQVLEGGLLFVWRELQARSSSEGGSCFKCCHKKGCRGPRRWHQEKSRRRKVEGSRFLRRPLGVAWRRDAVLVKPGRRPVDARHVWGYAGGFSRIRALGGFIIAARRCGGCGPGYAHENLFGKAARLRETGARGRVDRGGVLGTTTSAGTTDTSIRSPGSRGSASAGSTDASSRENGSRNNKKRTITPSCVGMLEYPMPDEVASTSADMLLGSASN